MYQTADPGRLAVSRIDSSVSSHPRGFVPTRPTESSNPPTSRARLVRMLMFAPMGLRTTLTVSGSPR